MAMYVVFFMLNAHVFVLFCFFNLKENSISKGQNGLNIKRDAVNDISSERDPPVQPDVCLSGSL